MPTFFSDIGNQLRAIWSRLDGGHRMTIAAVVLAAFVGLSAIIWLAGRPDYVTVYTATDATSFAEANQALTSSGIPVKTEGNDILVERTFAPQAQSVLFAAGVSTRSDPDSGDGGSGIASGRLETEDRMRAKYNRRAERAVMMLDGVVSAYVTSSKPKRSVYTALDKENQPGAAVTIKLRPGVAFRPIARNAIAAVSTAVGVAPNYITAINSRTKENYKLGEHGDGVGGSDFLSQQRERGRALTELAQAMLDRVYDGKAIVTVTVDLDPKYESREEKIQATDAIVSEDSTKDSTEQPGIPPTSAGDPGQVNTNNASGSSGMKQSSETTKRILEPFSGTRRVGMLSPDIRRMSVALVLDESLGDPAKVENVTNAVKAAVGFRESERDNGGLKDEISVLVEKLPELEDVDLGGGGSSMFDLVREFGPLAAQVLGVVLVLLFLRNLLKKSGSGSTARGTATAQTGSPVPGSVTPIGGTNAGGVEQEKDVVLTPEERRRHLRREIEKSIADDPGAMSRLLESWLAEQRM